jgi:hypothetical protein
MQSSTRTPSLTLPPVIGDLTQALHTSGEYNLRLGILKELNPELVATHQGQLSNKCCVQGMPEHEVVGPFRDEYVNGLHARVGAAALLPCSVLACQPHVMQAMRACWRATPLLLRLQ